MRIPAYLQKLGRETVALHQEPQFNRLTDFLTTSRCSRETGSSKCVPMTYAGLYL